MLAHGVSWLVPRLRRSLPRREKRGSEASRRECRRREYRSFLTRARRATSLFASPAARQCACGVPASRSLGEATQPREPQAQARGQASPQIRASERRHNPPETSRPRGMLVPRLRRPLPRHARKKKNVPAGFPRENVFFQEAFALRLICGGGARRRARARPSPRADRTPTVPESRRH